MSVISASEETDVKSHIIRIIKYAAGATEKMGGILNLTNPFAPYAKRNSVAATPVTVSRADCHALTAPENDSDNSSVPIVKAKSIADREINIFFWGGCSGFL